MFKSNHAWDSGCNLDGVLFILQVVLYFIFVTSSEFHRDDTSGMIIIIVRRLSLTEMYDLQ